MTPGDGVAIHVKRGRMRSRFRIGVLLGGLCLLAACTVQFGAGLAELPARDGWQPLPIGAWVVNDGLEPRTMVFCPRDVCAHQGMAALIAIGGARGETLEQALAADPARLAREFSKPAKPKARDVAKTRPGSATSVRRFDADGTPGLLVEITASGRRAKQAAAAILYARENGKLVLAIAVSDDAAQARRYAVAAWRSR